MTERDKLREIRKSNVIKSFVDKEKLYTNEIAKAIGVVWPVTDKILQELVEEGRLFGNKVDGYTLFSKKRSSLLGKIKSFFHA